ncbi:DUF6383 domain-containing protein [Parabacteroides johnsonii]|uniref:DUF6383 domain-containing protein n=2 Tax=Parabacteroides johnsonii TaxID=387661 RepID=A0AAW6I6D3_9BACT|nr:DUF6383 domain-containing protein [Parabacteroides johnsonii]MDC7149192.1 DUF6383 domain-containing protein [Parabacteroides johnsonii]MDC7156312.1 DUF6383 domain-containing protein [Parabacteroides johnsonii]
MNKRFSTLMTAGLMMLGALFSNANAQASGAGVEAVTGNVKDFSGYYLLSDGTNGFLKGKEATIENTKFTVLAGTVQDEFAANATIEDEYFWTIEPQLTAGTADGVTVTGFKFKNKKTKAYLTMADGTSLEPTTKPTITVFSWYDTYDATDGFKKVENGADLMMSTNGVVLSSGTTSLSNAGTVDIKPYRAKAKKVEADELNGTRGSFSFKAAGLETSIFAKNIKAFNVSTITTGFSETDVNKNIPAGVYFATSWGDLTDDDITTYEDFVKCTFIAIDPTTSLSKDDKEVKDGKNLGFVEVQGDDFNFYTASATGEQQSKNTEVYVGNAAFKVETSEAYLADDKYSYAITTVGNIRHLTEKGKTEQKTSASAAAIDVVEINDANKLTATVGATAGNVFTFGPNPISKVTRLLNSTGASIYNIRFESGKTEAEDEATEKGKYLSANFVTGTDYSLVAQGSAVADLNTPLYQFVISAVDTTQNIVTFRNREAGYEFNCELDTTTTAGVYYVTSATKKSSAAQFQVITVDEQGAYTEETAVGLTGKTITLIPATVDKFAGFAVRGENHDYIRLAFAKDANAEKLYVTVDETIPSAPVLAKVSDEEAAMFELVRNENPSYLKNDYVMLDDKGKVKTMSGKDTVAYYTYNIRYQVNNQDWYYLDNSALNLTQEQASIVPGATHAFIIKENKNGSVSIMDQIAYNAKAIEFKSATEKAGMSTAGAPYQNADAASVKLYIAQDVYGASLEAVPGHVAISAENGGYVSMDENGDARIAIKTAADVDLTFWLDTADVDATLPSFYISKGVKDAAERMYLYYATDSATYVGGPDAKNPYKWSNGATKLIFKAATLANSDTLVTTAKGQTVKVAMKQDADGTQAGLANFRFQIFKASDAEDAYVVRCGVQFLKNNNGELTLTSDVKDALRVYADAQEAPTANEGVEVATVKVIAGEGNVTIAGAQGKKVVVSNILGQTVANTVITSDNATIAAPQGVIVVAVEGEAAVKAIVK